MKKNTQMDPLFIDARVVMANWGVSRAQAYIMIKRMNEALLKEHPRALVVPGKVNRKWYEELCFTESRSK